MTDVAQQGNIFDILATTLSARHLSRKDEHVDAVVAILLREQTNSRLNVLLIHRAERANDPWSGQIGFPGGRVSRSDDSSHTAVRREVTEEVGIDLAPTARELGTLSIGSPMRVLNMRVQPWVYGLVDFPKIRIGPEVQEAFWAEVSRLPSMRSTAEVEIRGIKRQVDSFLINDHVVWGYTHRVLTELLSIIDLRA